MIKKTKPKIKILDPEFLKFMEEYDSDHLSIKTKPAYLSQINQGKPPKKTP
jgi:hypothetical protein